MQPSLSLQSLSLGVCYYPEHWPRSLWEQDFARMRELGIRYVRMGEFAWTLMESQDGVFDFSLFDEAMDLAAKYRLKVIFGTPTATPPVWLTEAHPEVFNANRDGVLYRHGQRRHYNYNSAVYRFYVERIVTELARHFYGHPALWAWQVDNELNCEIHEFYSQADRDAFRAWAKERYGTLDALNDAWGTVFWNQIYTDWEQVSLPWPTVTGVMNPHQALDMKRFISDSARSFCELQADLIRKYCPGTLVTTNGLFGRLDNHAMTRESLDFFSYDSYPDFAYGGRGPAEEDTPRFLDRWWSRNLSQVRGISPTFAVMEQQSGPGGSVSGMCLPSPKPGQMRLWTWQSVAHGADLVSFFRWRTATFGTEIYWHGLLDYGGIPNRRTAELETLRTEFAIGGRIAGSRYEASCALLQEYGNQWDGEYDAWHGPLTRRSEAAWFKATQTAHIPMDFVRLSEDVTVEELARYKVLVFPHPAVLTEKTAALLHAYCEQGGKLILGARSGYKDEHGQCYPLPLPGVAADLTGTLVQDFTPIGPEDAPVPVVFLKGESKAALFCDILEPTGNTEVLAVFGGDYYENKAALTRHAVGNGEAYYYGSAFDKKAADLLLGMLELASPARDMAEIPEAVELAVRSGPTGRFAFLLNYLHAPQTVRLLLPQEDVLTGRILEGDVELPPYGVLILNWNMER